MLLEARIEEVEELKIAAEDRIVVKQDSVEVRCQKERREVYRSRNCACLLKQRMKRGLCSLQLKVLS